MRASRSSSILMFAVLLAACDSASAQAQGPSRSGLGLFGQRRQAPVENAAAQAARESAGGSRAPWRKGKQQQPGGSPAMDAIERSAIGSEPLEPLTPDREVKLRIDLGRAQEKSGDPAAAVAMYRQALSVKGARISHETKALAHRRLGGALDRLGKFGQSEKEYRAALALSPRDPKIWNDLGYSYYLQGRLQEAETALKNALAQSPDDNRILTNLGLVQAASGDGEKALSSFTQAAGPAVAYANLGYSYAARGHNQEAREAYTEAIRMQPRLMVASQALANLNAEKPRKDEIPPPAAPPLFGRDRNVRPASARAPLPSASAR